MKTDILLSVSQYAKKEKISIQGVYKRINAGKLKTIKKFGLILIVE